MEIKDLIVTPFYLIVLYILAYAIRPYVTDEVNRKYFIPALSVKFFGAIALGLIYQFYYGGGDTFTYFHLGSRYVWNAFLDSPSTAFQMIFGDMTYTSENFEYASRIYTYGDDASYFVVRVAGFLDLFTFSTYTATALLFATLSFSGIWMIFLVFYNFYPRLNKQIAIAVLFVPSVFFWGSGLMKDTLTLGALGWLFYGFAQVLIFRRNLIIGSILFLLGFYTLYTVKIYIIICFLPALAFYLYFQYQGRINNTLVRYLLAPILISLGILSAYYTTLLVSAGHYRYSVDNVLYTAEQTAKWNYFVSQRDAGSGYTLGDYDFTTSGLVRKFVPAVVTAFFRPFLWEVRNPVMLLSALENMIIAWLFLSIALKVGNWQLLSTEPIIVLCLVFSLFFGFAIGVTTYNFGSLMRYKIPMLPFLIMGLLLLKNGRKTSLDRSHTA
ncbi:MAG: hypothetical protein JXQ96_04740 [Cyclobacteriaceae bacterium]